MSDQMTPEHKPKKTWEHCADWLGLAGAAALAAVAVLNTAGIPGQDLLTGELIAAIVATFITWAATGHGRLSLTAGPAGLFLASWTGWALHSRWLSFESITVLFGGILVMWPLLALAVISHQRKSALAPRAIEATDPDAALREEREKYEYMFSEVGCDGVQVTRIDRDRSGRVVRLQLPRSGKVTVSELEQASSRIEVILKLKPGAVRYEVQEHSADIIMRLREREVLVKEVQELTALHYARTINEPFAIGIEETGEVTKITLQGLHMYLVGTTGMGKSNLINVIIAQLARCPDTLIWVIDMKGGRTVRPWIAAWARGETDAPAIDWVATDRAEASRMMNAFKLGVRTRANSGIGGSKIKPSASRPQIILICDEMAELFNASKKSGRKAAVGEDGTTNSEFIDLAEEIAQLGRSEAASTAWATQKGTATFSGSGNLKSLCRLRVALGAANESDLQYIIPDAKASRKQMAYMASTPGVGMVAVSSNTSGLTRFFLHDHPEEQCYEEGVSEDRCVPECPVYRSSLEVGRVRPMLDRLTAVPLGADYAERWERCRDETTLLPGPLPASATAIASVDTTQFEAIMRQGGIKDEENDDHPARIKMRELLAARPTFGASPNQLWIWLKAEGLEVSRETVQRWLKKDSIKGLVHNPDQGRWKAGSGPNEWQKKERGTAA